MRESGGLAVLVALAGHTSPAVARLAAVAIANHADRAPRCAACRACLTPCAALSAAALEPAVPALLQLAGRPEHALQVGGLLALARLSQHGTIPLERVREIGKLRAGQRVLRRRCNGPAGCRPCRACTSTRRRTTHASWQAPLRTTCCWPATRWLPSFLARVPGC
jgi:hypothetical protein